MPANDALTNDLNDGAEVTSLGDGEGADLAISEGASGSNGDTVIVVEDDSSEDEND